MSRAERLAFALILLAAAFTASTDARRSFSRGSSRPSHSYPSSHGHSGSNSHHYPSSGGLSGTGSGGTHSYPSSGGLSGSNSHGHPSSGGVHQPHTPTHVNNVHASPGHANGHSYPSSTGLSGNNRGTAGSGSNVHYHQHVYQAPQQIHYTPVHGAAPMQPYPVYHGQPPVYIHEIRDSGSRYSTLLTGLALYNLGRSTSGSHHNHYQTENQPSSDNGERCTLRIEQDRNLEKVKIPCYIVSTFKDTSNLNSALSTTTTTSTAASVSTSAVPQTTVAPVSTSAVPETTVTSATTTITPIFNGTALNATTVDNATSAVNATGQANVTLAQNSTVTVQNVTVTQNTSSMAQNVPVRNGSEPVEAVKVKGEPLQLSKEARCFVETVSRTRTSVKEIECGLLQQYALQSMQRQQQTRRTSSASNNVAGSALTVLAVTVLKYIVF